MAFFMYIPKLSIKTWAEDDRPREKLLTKGKHVLSDAELLAIIIGSGSRELSAVELCKSILANQNNDLSSLYKITVADLLKYKGIGEAKAISIVAAIEFGKRMQSTNGREKAKITSSKDAYDLLFHQLSHLEVEEFWVLFLNKSNAVLEKKRFSIGGVSSTVVDVKVIVKQALENLASGVILAHNHPSGEVKPSNQDISITKKIKEGLGFLEINLLDHIIIGDNKYYSFADEGMV